VLDLVTICDPSRLGQAEKATALRLMFDEIDQRGHIIVVVRFTVAIDEFVPRDFTGQVSAAIFRNDTSDTVCSCHVA
jgi:hypothetical protein